MTTNPGPSVVAFSQTSECLSVYPYSVSQTGTRLFSFCPGVYQLHSLPDRDVFSWSTAKTHNCQCVYEAYIFYFFSLFCRAPFPPRYWVRELCVLFLQWNCGGVHHSRQGERVNPFLSKWSKLPTTESLVTETSLLAVIQYFLPALPAGVGLFSICQLLSIFTCLP